ncbi:MAG: hypothetical protein V1818_01705 [Candidatus Aenigmatarchaeota archaeon]
MDINSIEKRLSKGLDAKSFSNIISIAMVDNFGLMKDSVTFPFYMKKNEIFKYTPLGRSMPAEERLSHPPKSISGARYLDEKLRSRNMTSQDYTVRTILKPDPYKENFGEKVFIFAHHKDLDELENKKHTLYDNSFNIISRSSLGIVESKPNYLFCFEPYKIIDQVKRKMGETKIYMFM